jgi:hypothetical protein
MVVNIEREGRDQPPVTGGPLRTPSAPLPASGCNAVENAPRGVTGACALELERCEADLGYGRPWYQSGLTALSGVANGRAKDSSGTYNRYERPCGSSDWSVVSSLVVARRLPTACFAVKHGPVRCCHVEHRPPGEPPR